MGMPRKRLNETESHLREAVYDTPERSVKSQPCPCRLHRLPDLRLMRLDRQGTVPVVERAGVVALLRVEDPQVVQHRCRGWLQSQGALQLRNPLAVTVGRQQRRAQVRCNGVGLREHFLSLLQKSDRARGQVPLPVERGEIDEVILRV